MNPTGLQLVGGIESWQGPATLQAVDPRSGVALEPLFHEAMPGEVAQAAQAAQAAAGEYAARPAAARAAFLRSIARHLLDLGDPLLERCEAETGLPRARLVSERGRTLAQIEIFAALVEEGSWVDARLDRPQPARQPQPKPDLRRLLVALGPVAVFGASNFPLAFSVAGGDTISALAAGCPVVVKGHPGHPGTSELVARAILAAAAEGELPAGVFSLVQGASPTVGQALVTQPEIRAVGFTGSLRAGRALLAAAGRRAEPIPVFAEMGSCNPLFVLPEALAARGEALAAGLAASVTLGAGQFCTNPGLVVLVEGPGCEAFLARLGALLAGAGAGTVAYAGIKSGYDEGLSAHLRLSGVRLVAQSAAEGSCAATAARPALLAVDADTFLREPRLMEELFGPATLAVRCRDEDEQRAVAAALPGQLTASLHATPAELPRHRDLFGLLQARVGRLIVNGYPTGVEVCPSMQHGGPWPASSDARFTSVGTAAIQRFARPLCFQDVPAALLPEELRDENPRGLLRLVDGRPTREAL